MEADVCVALGRVYSGDMQQPTFHLPQALKLKLSEQSPEEGLINSRQPAWLLNAKPLKAHANQDGLMCDRPELPFTFLSVSLFSVFLC